jgi:hypothetical protein
MNAFRSENISRILKQHEAYNDDGPGDVVFAMFLEPHEPAIGTTQTVVDLAITFGVNNLQPGPVMSHVELVVPGKMGKGEPVNFATYFGQTSNWQRDRENNYAYYLSSNANKWRAVPVFGKQVAKHVRETCNNSTGIKYSMLRYFTATWPFRAFAAMVADKPKSPAHCATLTARILRSALGECLHHTSAWYGPSTLYRELSNNLRKQKISPETTLMTEETTDTVNTILRSRDEDVEIIDEVKFLDAIRALTLKAAAAEAFGDSTSRKLTQRRLATALLRWSVLRMNSHVSAPVM